VGKKTPVVFEGAANSEYTAYCESKDTTGSEDRNVAQQREIGRFTEGGGLTRKRREGLGTGAWGRGVEKMYGFLHAAFKSPVIAGERKD